MIFPTEFLNHTKLLYYLYVTSEIRWKNYQKTTNFILGATRLLRGQLTNNNLRESEVKKFTVKTERAEYSAVEDEETNF